MCAAGLKDQKTNMYIRKQLRSGHQMKSRYVTFVRCDAMADTNMFPLKAAGHILPDCGHGSSHPGLPLELQL
eukprot:6771709-Prorocentrum_lima.AAC.1